MIDQEKANKSQIFSLMSNMIPNQEYPVYFSNPSTQYLKGKDSQVVLINLNFWSVSKNAFLTSFSWLVGDKSLPFLIITVFFLIILITLKKLKFWYAFIKVMPTRVSIHDFDTENVRFGPSEFGRLKHAAKTTYTRLRY